MPRSGNSHLADIGESYGEHLAKALGFSFALARASIACAVHAVLPELCTDTASRAVAELNAKLARRAALGRAQYNAGSGGGAAG